jgi:ABC-type transporter Mla subunit MlaD
LMFVQTIVYRLAEDQLARVDGWIVEYVLPKLGHADGPSESLAPYFEQLRNSLVEALAARLGDGFAPAVARFSQSVEPLPAALSTLKTGSEAIGRAGASLAQLDDSLRRLNAGLARIESTLQTKLGTEEALEPIRRGLDRTTAAVESLAERWTTAYERSNRTSQEQLGRTLASLKDALDMIHVSAEQSNALYRSIVKKMFDDRGGPDIHRAA